MFMPTESPTDTMSTPARSTIRRALFASSFAEVWHLDDSLATPMVADARSARNGTAMGGLGGFVPPLVMGAVYGATDSYRIGLLLLAAVAAGALAYTWAHRSGRAAT